jgi:hypothetical protein
VEAVVAVAVAVADLVAGVVDTALAAKQSAVATLETVEKVEDEANMAMEEVATEEAEEVEEQVFTEDMAVAVEEEAEVDSLLILVRKYSHFSFSRYF